MKLIDILARDLDEWPEGAEFIVQDKDGEAWPSRFDFRPRLCKNRFDEWASAVVGKSLKLSESEDWLTAIITREQWEEARRGLKEHSHEVTPQWRGPEDGPPPAGTEVQYRRAVGVVADSDISDGDRFTVRHTFQNSNEFDMAVIESEDASCLCCLVECLKPLKSDRDQAIDAATEVLEDAIIMKSGSPRDGAAALYDAGMLKGED